LLTKTGDWTADCGGHPKINYDRFVVAMFKLCDVWTDFVDGESYLDLLVALSAEGSDDDLGNGGRGGQKNSSQWEEKYQSSETRQ
jgi:hypothetical protein